MRLNAGEHGLVKAAEFRAYDAETLIGAVCGGKRVTRDLSSLGQEIRVSEYDQLRFRGNTNNELVRNSIATVTVNVAKAVADRMEALRGQVLATGTAVIAENQFLSETDFGCDEQLNVTPGTKWGGCGWRDVCRGLAGGGRKNMSKSVDEEQWANLVAVRRGTVPDIVNDIEDLQAAHPARKSPKRGAGR